MILTTSASRTHLDPVHDRGSHRAAHVLLDSDARRATPETRTSTAQPLQSSPATPRRPSSTLHAVPHGAPKRGLRCAPLLESRHIEASPRAEIEHKLPPMAGRHVARTPESQWLRLAGGRSSARRRCQASQSQELARACRTRPWGLSQGSVPVRQGADRLLQLAEVRRSREG